MTDEPKIHVKQARYGFLLLNERNEYAELTYDVDGKPHVKMYPTRDKAQSRADELNDLR